MKVDALDHPKTLDLAARLAIELPTAIGHLELLWWFTGKKAPQGNIGKHPDGAIARACYWMGDPAQFITALIDAGFVERDVIHRLLIHDWSDHAQRWVLARLKALGQTFAVATAVETAVDPAVEGSATAVETTVATAVESLFPLLPSLSQESEAHTPRARPAARAQRLPENFELTPERRALAEREHLDPERTFEKFCNHWRAASGANARKRDWPATWANWCMTEHDRATRPLNGVAVLTPKRRERPPTEAEVEKARRQAADENAQTAARLGLSDFGRVKPV